MKRRLRLAQLTAQLERFGVGTTAQETIAGAFDIGALTDLILDLLASVAALSSSLLLVVTLLLFMAIDASMFPISSRSPGGCTATWPMR